MRLMMVMIVGDLLANLILIGHWSIGDVNINNVLNPICIYDRLKLNTFGTFLVSIGLNALFPLCSVAYWTYKLLTIGRH